MISDLLPGPWDDRAPHALRCHFGICTREAELELTLADDVAPVLVCSIHVAPVLGWGVPEPLEPRLRYLPVRPESAA